MGEVFLALEVLLVHPAAPPVDLRPAATGDPPEPPRRGEAQGDVEEEAGQSHHPDWQRRAVLDVENLGGDAAEQAQREVHPPGEVGDAELTLEAAFEIQGRTNRALGEEVRWTSTPERLGG